MISTRHDIDAGRKNLLRGPGSDAGTSCGVFAIGDDCIEGMALTEERHELLHGAAPRLPHDIADEKNSHGQTIGIQEPGVESDGAGKPRLQRGERENSHRRWRGFWICLSPAIVWMLGK